MASTKEPSDLFPHDLYKHRKPVTAADTDQQIKAETGMQIIGSEAEETEMRKLAPARIGEETT